MPQGTTIDRFLDQVRQEFKELRSVNVENLLFIKEDLIIPHVRVHSATVPSVDGCSLVNRIWWLWNNAALQLLRPDCDQGSRQERAAI